MGVPVYKRILDLFEAEGVNTLFGIPPDPNFVHMFTEADARGWSVVAPHHELSAGFMAEAASRMTGKPGLCIGTLGPGMANIAGAIQCALVENSPVIFLGGSGPGSPNAGCGADVSNSSSRNRFSPHQ